MKNISDLLQTIAKLRAPDGCPWDREQTHESLRPYLIEEAAETLDAIDRKNDKDTEEELGDVLLQILLHAQIASERGSFDFKSICSTLNEKMIRRHPHVFGNVSIENTDDVLKNWKAIKAKEKNNSQEATVSPLQELAMLPPPLSSLNYAMKVSSKLRKIGEGKRCDAVAETVHATANQVSAESIAAQIFVLADKAKQAGIDIDMALRDFCREVISK